jgi:fatty acid desaturase
MKVEMSKSFSEGMGWRVATSIITFFASIIGIILWLFFYAENFNAYQNIAIVVVIFLGFIAVMGATWASWGMKQREAWRSSKKDDFE